MTLEILSGLRVQNPCFCKSLDPRGAYFPIHPSSRQCIITMPSNLQSASCICNIECTNIHTKGPKSSIGKTIVTSVIEIGSGSCSVVFTRLHDQWRLESRKVRDPDRDPSQGNSFPNSEVSNDLPPPATFAKDIFLIPWQRAVDKGSYELKVLAVHWIKPTVEQAFECSI